MWDLINCFLSGRHDYGMWCETGEMFLRCVHCGKRSSGWAVETKFRTTAPRPVVTSHPAIAARASLASRSSIAAVASSAPVSAARVIPFERAAAS